MHYTYYPFISFVPGSALTYKHGTLVYLYFRGVFVKIVKNILDEFQYCPCD